MAKLGGPRMAPVEFDDYETLWVRELTAGDAKDLWPLLAACGSEEPSFDVFLAVAHRGICDERGRRFYGVDKGEAVADLPARVVMECANKILVLCDFGADGAERSRKNSESRSDGSGTE